jgi:gliding motility-associated-like protein
MKKFIVTLVLSMSFLLGFSAHIKGGFFTYEYLGKGVVNPAYLRYNITLTVYMEVNPSAGQLNQQINFTLFEGNATTVYANPSVDLHDTASLFKTTDEPCISGDQSGAYYTIATYILSNYELPLSALGYTIAYQRCCRIPNMENIQNSGAVGNTYTISIPGTNSLVPDANKNNSPNFPINDTAVVCGGSFFTYPFSAIDKDGDVLTYTLCSAYEGGTSAAPTPNPSDAPPFPVVSYSSPYFGSQPMGPGVTINPTTGLISGIAPVATTPGGEFVVTVCVTETRNGVYLASTRKELHIKVKDCTPVKAYLAPRGVTCDGFSVNFSNGATNISGTLYNWEFGDPASGINNSSALETPNHVYVDTGLYKIKLTVSIGGSCTNSDTLIVRVYPGFFPDFNTVGNLCKGAPVQFADNSVAKYGTPTGWRWNFGNAAATNDTSRLKNPTYIYPDSGTYQVKLIVGSTLGCVDSITKNVVINNSPVINLIPHDTLICFIDTLQIKTTNTGSFSWSPNYNISSLTSPNPLVSPKIPTTYYLTFTDVLGCVNKDSVFVDVKTKVTVNAGNDTTICRTDGLIINTTGTGLHYIWTPALYLNSDTAKRPFANPLVAVTLYKVVANIGKCKDSATVKITTLPYPVANAGKDTSVCFGKTAFLKATGGVSYQWTPSTFLSAANIANPTVLNPTITTQYIVAVRDVVGCPKPAYDTVIVRVDPPLLPDAGPSDTTVVLGEPLYLNGSGGQTYLWQPSRWLSNPGIANPIALPDDNITYQLLVTSISGCQASDSIRIKLYKVPPSFYVPTGFSPNNDGKNDILKPILLGMKSLNYFRVFDRWGRLLFYTTQKGAGWDGTYKGNPQDPGTYVWMASGATFTGEVIVRKGYAVLLR